MHALDERRAHRVRANVEAMYHLFRGHANRLFFHETVKRQPDIGSGRPGAEAQQRTHFAQKHTPPERRDAIHSELDLVVLGYWCEGDTGYTCSRAEHGLLRAVHSAWVREAVRKENAWRLKGSQKEWLEVAHAAERFRDVEDPATQMTRLGRLLTLCARGQPIDSAFPPGHAEGQMMAYLMTNPPRGPVDLYLTRSPCRQCANGFARLSALHKMYDNILKNLPAHDGKVRLTAGVGGPAYELSYEEFRHEYEECGFGRWSIGWVLYGAPYAHPADTTDWAALERAKANGSIAGCERLY
jgi:hypothetical protein